MASPAFVSGTALKRDRLLGGVGASLAKEVRLAREMQRVGSGPILRSGVATLAQTETDRMRTFSIGLNRDVQSAFTGLDTARAAQGAAAAMFPGIRASEALRSVSLLGGARLSKDAQRMLERGAGLGEVHKAMERYNAIQTETDRMRTFSIGLNRDVQSAFTGLDTARAAQGAAAAMFPGIRTSEALRSVSLLGGARLSKDAQRMLERGAGLGEVHKVMERYNAIQADWLRIDYAAASGDVVASAEEATSEATLDLDLADIAFRRWLKRLSPSQVKWLGIYLLSLQQVGLQLEASGWVELPEPFNRSLSAALWFLTVLAALADESRER